MGTCGVKNPIGIFLGSVLCLLYHAALFCNAVSNFTSGQQVRDGETIVSPNGVFALGFFSPVNSTARYVGVWYNNAPGRQVVWVANRETPIVDKNGVLQIGGDGRLAVSNGDGTPIWKSSTPILSKSFTATLDDSGNIKLWAANAGHVGKSYWQSFDNPTDTYLPGMMVKVSAELEENNLFRSWKSESDPSPGRYYMGLDRRGSPQIVVWDGPYRRWRSGHWNGMMFMGVPTMSTNLFYGFRVTQPEPDGNAYISYTPLDSSSLIRFLIRSDGIEEGLGLAQGSNKWSVFQSQPTNECEIYKKCGNFGICDMSGSPICRCMRGFVPADKKQWESGDWSGGCVRETQLQCRVNRGAGGGDWFTGEKCMKLPDFADHVAHVSDKHHCMKHCSGNCSCNAYAFVSGIGCLIWNSGTLVDAQHFAGYGMQETLNIRLGGSVLGGKIVILLLTVGGALFICALVWRFRAKLKVSTTSWLRINEHRPKLPMFSFRSIVAATDNFSEHNKLGEGGFGPVYKGKLPGGQEVAVKRLSRKSGQGLEEFKNEIKLIAKLQHRNLVRLLGSCIEPEENILVYEYMPNKSLDYFLFDPTKGALLDWTARFNIIEGTARGILYLHRDSRLRIIHRDLKASNVLLDKDKNPKISDFGMARIFGENQDEANTKRVVGTYGYMSPEYAMEGLFSVKSDVYSFGVLLLEIVSGRRNTSFRLSDHVNLIGFAWHLWKEGKVMDLVDPSIADSCPQNEVLRCIQIGMLCVEDNAAYRPTMSGVVLMLESDTVHVDLPRQPTTYAENLFENQRDISLNELTATTLVGR